MTKAQAMGLYLLRQRKMLCVALTVIGLNLLLAAGLAFTPQQHDPKHQLKQEWSGQRAEYWQRIEQARAQGQLEQAIRVAELLVDTERRLWGHGHELVLDSLGRMAGLYTEHGAYAAARRVWQGMADLLAAQHGATDWRTTDARLASAHVQRLAELHPEQWQQLREADRAEQQARQLRDAGQYRKAIVLFEQAIVTYQGLLGCRNRAVFNRLSDLAGTYVELDEWNRAEALHQLALCFCWQTVGAAHPISATLLNNFGTLYNKLADYERAEQLHRQALETNRTLFGDDHIAVAGDLNNLGSLYRALGDYGRAETALQRAEAIFRKHLGDRHPSYATCLSNLGSLYMDWGNYDRAEQLYRRSLAIRQQALPAKHPDYAASLNNLGTLYHVVNDYAQAMLLYREAAAIIQQTLGEEHLVYAITLDNMAQVCVDAGWNDLAEEMAVKALAVKKKVCGDRHPAYADSLHNLAVFYLTRRQRDLVKAEPLLRRVVELRKEILGERHPDYGASLHYLAALHRLTGACDQAETVALRSRAIRREVLGPDHPACAFDLTLLAEIYAATGRTSLALSTLNQTLALEEKHLEHVSTFTTESAMQLHLAKANRSLLLLLSLVVDHAAGDRAACEQALTWVLRRKGAVLNALCRFREVQRVLHHHPDIARQAARVRASREYVNNLALRPPAGTTEESFKQELSRRRLDCDRQEADLHRTLVQLRPPADAATAEVDVAAVRRRLGREAALVEFVGAELYDFRATGRQPLWKPPRYLAFILTADPAPPRLIDLGEVQEIDPGIRDLRERLARAPRELGVTGEKHLDAEFCTHSAALGRRLFERLRPGLGSATHVYLAPDGNLNLLPFEALAGADGSYLAERFRFSYLSGGRDLLRPKTAPAAGTAVFAAPDFDWQAPTSQPTTVPPTKVDQGDARLVLRGLSVRELRGLRWKNLPAAGAEAADVRGLLQESPYGPVQTWIGPAAREDAFKALRNPRILHLATHGYFLPARPLLPEDRNGAPPPAGESPAGAARGMARLRGLHALFRSGLVLAGANQLGAGLAQGEDGWVTAEEIAMMDLKGTELVVLSACESGLGDVQAGEGVFGLRRAFLYAGADTLVVSLFKVPDTETRDLMQAFYKGLKAGKDKLAALHDARQAMINARRLKHGAAHPFFWASFVLVGAPN